MSDSFGNQQEWDHLQSQLTYLRARVKELEGERDEARQTIRDWIKENQPSGWIGKLRTQLHQRDTALVAAREALEWMKSHPHSGPNDELDSHYTDLCHECQMIDHALSQIQACEVKR